MWIFVKKINLAQKLLISKPIKNISYIVKKFNPKGYIIQISLLGPGL